MQRCYTSEKLGKNYSQIQGTKNFVYICVMHQTFFEGHKMIIVHKDNFVSIILWKETNWAFIFEGMICKLAKAHVRYAICLVHEFWNFEFLKKISTRCMFFSCAHVEPEGSTRHTKKRFTRIFNSFST